MLFSSIFHLTLVGIGLKTITLYTERIDNQHIQNKKNKHQIHNTLNNYNISNINKTGNTNVENYSKPLGPF